MANARAYGADGPATGLAPMTVERREPRPDDVAIEILYCGICHTDIHFVENDWGLTVYPIVPGHEIIGRVTGVGEQVSGFRAGDLVAVGCMVDSCRECHACRDGIEQYCAIGPVLTYNGRDRHDGSLTYGGYSESIVVSERFVVRVPDGLDPASAAPLLCAGITTYSPLRHYGVRDGHRVGVVGMGGLGHMGIKFARALGAEVTLFTRSQAKADDARAQGADHVVISRDDGQMGAMSETLDYVLDTVPVQHDLNPYLAALKPDGIHILVGLLEPVEPPLEAGALVMRRRVLAGSLIGGIPETEEVLEFCAEHGIGCDVEMLDIGDVNDAYERVKRGDVKYRFVIDMATLKR